MRDFQLDLVIGTGPAAKAVRIDLPHFTLVGATTRVGLTASPLHASFGIVHRFVFYSPDELSLIIQRTAELLEVPLDPEGAYEIARRSRGTPRIANRLLRRVRDFAQIQGNRRVDQARARRALAHLEIDEQGLDEIDRRIIRLLIERFGGGPANLKELAASLGEGSADRRGHLRAVLDPKGASATYRPRRRGHEAGVRAPGPARPEHAALGLEHLGSGPEYANSAAGMAQPHCLDPLRCWFWRQGARRPPAGAGSEGEGPSEAVGKRRPMPLQKPTPNRSAADRSERSPSIHPISAKRPLGPYPFGPGEGGCSVGP